MTIAFFYFEEKWRKIIQDQLMNNIQFEELEFVSYESSNDYELECSDYDLIFFYIDNERYTEVLEYCKKYKEKYPDADYPAVLFAEDMEYANAGYSVLAFRYICAKSLEEQLTELCQKIVYMKQSKKAITFNLHNFGETQIAIDNIYAIETNNRDLYLVVAEQKFLIKGKLDDMEKLLTGYGFYRIHRGVLINVKYVRKIEKDYLTLKNDDNKKYPISRRVHKDFINAYFSHEIY